MSDQMRRIRSDRPIRSTEADREQIAADVDKFLANGGRIQECEIGETALVYGITQHRIKTAQKANKKGRESRYR